MATRCMLGEGSQKETHSKPEQGHEGHIHEVLQEDGYSSKYRCNLLCALAYVIPYVFLICLAIIHDQGN